MIIDDIYKPIHKAVDKLCAGYSYLLFCKGRPGTGKSWNIRKVLKENNSQFVEVSGEVTEAYLYRLIFENNGKIIWFKDVATLLGGLKSINILKAATETEQVRMITKGNYSTDQKDLPDSFECKCKFIFDYNNVQNNVREDFEALISRGDFIEFTLSPKEIELVMNSICKDDEEKEVTAYVLKHFEGSGLVRMNLRTQWKAIQTYKYAKSKNLDWQDEVSTELSRVNRTRSMLYGLIGNKAIRKVDLKKLLIKYEIVNSVRTAENRIREWIFLEELNDYSPTDRNSLVSLIPLDQQSIEELQ